MKKRHILSFFNELPEPYRSQAIENFADFSKVYYLVEHRDRGSFDHFRFSTSMVDALLDGFHWLKTPQGYKYWWAITEKYSLENKGVQVPRFGNPESLKFVASSVREVTWMPLMMRGAHMMLSSHTCFVWKIN